MTTKRRHASPNWRGRQLDDWTPPLLRLAFARAEHGDLQLAGELVDALLCDDRVQGCLLALRGLFGLPLTFETGLGPDRAAAALAAEGGEDFFWIAHEEQLMRLLAHGALLGVAVAELRWEHDGRRWIPRLHAWDPRWLRCDETGWQIQTTAGLLRITPGDGKWVLFTPFGAERPWLFGAWRSLARFWLLKRYAITDWGRHSELAGGIRVATTEGDDSKREQLAADLAEIGKDTSVALPKGWELTAVAPAGEGFQTFAEQIDAANKAIAIALLGQNLSTEVTGGSYAAATVHTEVKDSVLRMYAAALSTCLHDQVLSAWAGQNFDDESAAPWPVWETTPQRDRSAVITSFAGAAAGLAAAGVDVRALAESLGLPLVQAPPGNIPREPSPAPPALEGPTP
jgi:hypothetical protein